MDSKKPGYINVDELLPRITLGQVAQWYGVPLPELKRLGDETRASCFLACGRSEETGPRALAIQTESPTKPWACHQYGCGKSGNLVGLCDLLKQGPNAGGRPRGERFKAIAADLLAIVEGLPPVEQTPPPVKQPAKREERNVPLHESDNERARELLTLDAQFVTDPALMPPDAAGYFRRRPFLTPDSCAAFRVGYLPRSAKSLLRGKIVYPYHSPTGEILTWFGRDPGYETKHRLWQATDRADDPSAPEPVKTQFVRGFHRGLEVWGENVVRTREWPDPSRSGLVIVEGPNDAINLLNLGLPTVALCSNTITVEQVVRIATLAHDVAEGRVTLLLDTDEAGDNGLKQVLPLLAERLHVRVPWRRTSHGGRYQDRQPEQLTAEELARLLGCGNDYAEGSVTGAGAGIGSGPAAAGAGAAAGSPQVPD